MEPSNFAATLQFSKNVTYMRIEPPRERPKMINGNKTNINTKYTNENHLENKKNIICILIKSSGMSVFIFISLFFK